MRRVLKIVFKVLGAMLALAFVILVIQFYRFSTPKSDSQILKDFSKANKEVFLSRNNFSDRKFRVLASQKDLDSTKITLVFVHGSIGSAMDFKKYFQDDELLEHFNMISYDRIGYGQDQTGKVMESIGLESALLDDLIKEIPNSKLVLVGYSYGGPIALALNKGYRGILLLAPAVYSKVEPMPWALNFYKWKLTRWMLPKVWKAASIEKLSHPEDLKRYEDSWSENISPIVSIHGDKDWIVPMENSLFLEENFEDEQFDLITLYGAGHGLVWTHFDTIKELIIERYKK